MRTAIDVLAGRPLVVLTGAGLSTDSGIPDYRGPGRLPRTPMTAQQFRSGIDERRRYWARTFVGYERMSGARPNAGHHALATLDPGILITQNVDGLHEAAGSRFVVALHGRVSDIICLDCGASSSRARLQERLEEANPGWLAAHADVVDRPDGDVEIEDSVGFVVPACDLCGGVLKPDVVFFGENVPAPRVQRCYDAVDALGSEGALLVVGSSLTVMSGLRFVKRAARQGTPIVIVNRGETRGDALASVKLDAGASEFLVELAAVVRAA